MTTEWIAEKLIRIEEKVTTIESLLFELLDTENEEEDTLDDSDNKLATTDITGEELMKA